MTDEAGAPGAEPAPSRRFGQLPDLVVPADFDDPLPSAEITAWEAPGRAGLGVAASPHGGQRSLSEVLYEMRDEQ